MSVRLCRCGSPIRGDGYCRWRCETPDDRRSKKSELAKAREKSRVARVEAGVIGISAADQTALVDLMAGIDPVAAHKLKIARQKKRGVKR